jgi:hypothetical protein
VLAAEVLAGLADDPGGLREPRPAVQQAIPSPHLQVIRAM